MAVVFCLALEAGALETKPVDLNRYPSLQAAIDANPGRMIQVPEGEYRIDAALKIVTDGTGLWGPAKIIQTNPHEPILLIQKARGVRIENLTLTRAEGKMEAGAAGVDLVDTRDVELYRLRVSENHSHSSIRISSSKDVTVDGCTITNYKGETIDDRTNDKPNLIGGYAFKSIDGTGIQAKSSEDVTLRNNRINEYRLLPTKETRDKYDLGTLTVALPVHGRLLDEEMFRTRYTNNWHQGAGIQVSSSGGKDCTRVIITGNSLEYPAQGLDIHSDNVTVANNIISHAMLGMKAMHGAKHVLINGNQFTYCDLWGILLMPGTASHAPANAEGDKPEVSENADGGTIVSNNIFSNFGFGEQYWNWVGHKTSPNGTVGVHSVIDIVRGQRDEGPAIHDILVTGNLVYDSGRDGVKLDGKWQYPPPRYHYALFVEQTTAPVPVNVRVFGNLFNPGLDGEMNFSPKPSSR